MSENLDSVIDSIPVSFFHYRLLLMCGLAFMADAMEVSLLTILGTCAGTIFYHLSWPVTAFIVRQLVITILRYVGNEWGLSNVQRASITGVVFCGELLGGLFWGPVADRYGRKKAFLMASCLIVIFGFLSGAAPSFEWLLTFRVFVGFGVGGLTVPFDLLAEFLPVSDRGKFLIYIEYFWTFGSLFVAGVAWLALDIVGWRGLSYITAVPVTLSSIAAFVYLPESPRWLLIKGRHEEAEEVVRCAAATSGILLSPFSFSCNFDSSPEMLHFVNDQSNEPVKDTALYDLVRTPAMRRLSIPLGIIWIAFGFTYYGIVLFVSRLFTATADDLLYSGSTAVCTFDYESLFINASAELLGVFLTSLVIDPWGRTRTQAAFYALAGISVLLMGLELPSLSLLPYISMVARLGAMGASCATWVATSELYPTEMRATGHSICSSLAKLGSFIVPYLVVSSVDFSTIGLTLAFVNFIASAVAFALPDTTGTNALQCHTMPCMTFLFLHLSDSSRDCIIC
jgi:MFS family permease